MKTKLGITVILLIVIAKSLYSQTYKPMVLDGATWFMKYGYEDYTLTIPYLLRFKNGSDWN